jgi:hypothetical protein
MASPTVSDEDKAGALNAHGNGTVTVNRNRSSCASGNG